MGSDQPPGFVPFPMHMMPVPVAPPPDAQNQVPARVKVAMVFLESLTAKTAARGLVNDVGFDTIEGQKLTVEELAAQFDALHMLRLYFGGALGPSAWETYALECGRPAVPLAECPRCRGDEAGREKCRRCGGLGRVTVR